MPPCATPIFAAPDVPIVMKAVPLDLDTELEGDVMEIQQQLDVERKRLEDDAKAQIIELREKKQKEKADQKKQEYLKHLRKMIKSQWEGKQACYVDINRVSFHIMSHDLELTCLFSPPKLWPMPWWGHPRGR